MRSLLASAVCALAFAPGADAAPDFLAGVADDSTKWTARVGPLGATYRRLGLDAVRVTVKWRPYRTVPDADTRRGIARSLRATDGLRLVLAVYGKADQAPRGRRARVAYCAYVRWLVLRYPEVRDVVIWNEANSPTFWRPQKGAAAAYGALLGRCWRVLHAARPDVNVISTTAAAHDPAGFVRGLGPSARVDILGHNPYPADSSEPPWTLHPGSGRIAQGDVGRLRAAVLEAFGERKPVWYLEQGFQTATSGWPYFGRENERRPTGNQAAQVADALRLAACQEDVQAFFNFQLVDERDRRGWQSGLIGANGRRKPAFRAYRAAIAEIRSGSVDCSRFPVAARG